MTIITVIMVRCKLYIQFCAHVLVSLITISACFNLCTLTSVSHNLGFFLSTGLFVPNSRHVCRVL